MIIKTMKFCPARLEKCETIGIAGEQPAYDKSEFIQTRLVLDKIRVLRFCQSRHGNFHFFSRGKKAVIMFFFSVRLML